MHHLLPAATAKQPHLWELLHRISHTPHLSGNVPQTTQPIRLIFSSHGEKVRKVVRRSNYRQTGKWPSPKNGKMVHWESQNELAGFQLLEACPTVKRYQEQPAEIHYQSHKFAQVHIPDVYVELINGRKCFLEFKSDNALEDAFLIQRSHFLASHLPLLGYAYLMVAKYQLGGIPQANAIKLNRFISPKVSLSIKEEIRRALVQAPNISIQALLAKLPPPIKNRALIYSLMLSGDIAFDMFIPLCGETLVTWVEGR